MKSHGNKRYKKTVKGAKSYKLLVGGLANILDLEDTVIRGECRTDRSYPVPMLLIVKLLQPLNQHRVLSWKAQ
jgi:hypothetical protein